MPLLDTLITEVLVGRSGGRVPFYPRKWWPKLVQVGIWPLDPKRCFCFSQDPSLEPSFTRTSKPTKPFDQWGDAPTCQSGEPLSAFTAIWSQNLTDVWVQNIVSRGYKLGLGLCLHPALCCHVCQLPCEGRQVSALQQFTSQGISFHPRRWTNTIFFFFCKSNRFIFLKANGDIILIPNLKCLNKFHCVQKFIMEPSRSGIGTFKLGNLIPSVNVKGCLPTHPYFSTTLSLPYSF